MHNLEHINILAKKMHAGSSEALSELEKLADEGSPHACLYVGDGHFFKLGTQFDARKAFDFYNRATELGSAEGWLRSARACLFLDDKSEALSRFKTAYIEGFIEAAAHIGRLQKIDGHFTTALEWLSIAADKGHALALRNRASIFIRGSAGKRQIFSGLRDLIKCVFVVIAMLIIDSDDWRLQ